MDDMQLSLNNTLSPNASRPVILVVDDNEDNLLLVSLAVEQFLNCSPIVAADGETAISLAQLYRPDIILLDIVLPDLNGFEVIDRLKQHWQTKTIPVVAVTALAREEECDRILAAGCDGYLSKPYMLDDLEKVIYRYLRTPCLV
ncbi:response regulator [Argonema antarcticum]|uniref:response regulator n=1 Tax=Argonema antarcticum TaxID=2942763 RepID=UPI002010F18F|nr:response regulator [Argonema antarcticum]MCL1474907.1 response regulator [Argonema antarcticum A004/B2]